MIQYQQWQRVVVEQTPVFYPCPDTMLLIYIGPGGNNFNCHTERITFHEWNLAYRWLMAVMPPAPLALAPTHATKE